MRLSKWCSGFLAAVLLPLVLAGNAGATNYYVSNSAATTPEPSATAYPFYTPGDSAGVWPGRGAAGGLGTLLAPFRYISSANAVVGAGDTVYVYSLTPADTADLTLNVICPAVAGTHALHITYIGRFHTDDWGQHLPVPSVLDTMSYITIRGFRVKDNITLEHMAGSGPDNAFYPKAVIPKQPNTIRIDSCRAQRIEFFGVDSCTVTHNIFDNSGTAITQKHPTVQWSSNDGKLGERECGSTGFSSPGWCVSYNHANEFSYNTVDGGHVENTDGTSQKQFFVMRGRSNHNVIKQNRFSATFDDTSGDVSGRVLYYAHDNTFLGNRWTFEADHAVTGSDQWSCATIRDSSSNNTFRRDTIYAGLTSYRRMGFKLLSKGNYGSGTMEGTEIDSCLFRTTGNVWVSDKFTNSSITHSVFDANTSPALYFVEEYMSNSSVNNNTIFCRRMGPAMQMGELYAQDVCTVKQNIFYTDSVQALSEGDPPNSAGCYNGTSKPVFYAPRNIGTSLDSDRNLFFSRIGVNTLPTKDKLAVANSNFASAVGSSALNCWAGTYGHDQTSLYGDPGFADTTWAAFNPRFVYGTLADSSNFIDYAGAYAPTDPTTAPDTTYALSGSVFAGAKLGATTKTLMYSYVQPDSGAHLLKWVIRTKADGAGNATLGVNIPADSALSQAGFDTFIATGGDSVFVVMNPDVGDPHTHNNFVIGSKSATGTHDYFWIQAQQVDVWGNKSAFTYRKVVAD